MNFELKKEESKKDLPVVNLIEGVENSIIKELAFDMFKLAQSLKEKALVYDTIISDDASGRPVSLFLKKVFDGLRKRQNQPPIKINFIASGRELSEDKLGAIKEFLGKKKNKLGRVLLVTEYVETGESIAKVIHILNSIQVDFDLAALSVSNIRKAKELKMGGLKGDFFFGNESYFRGGVELHGKSSLSGVVKDTENNSPFPERVKDMKDEAEGWSGWTEEQKLKFQVAINMARRDIDNLAKNTLKLLK